MLAEKKNGNFQENFVPILYSISYLSVNPGGPEVPLRDHRERKQQKCNKNKLNIDLTFQIT